jgi:pilus assembly protein Flp/PilA
MSMGEPYIKKGWKIMKNLVNWFKNEESGQGMVEYALIIGLVSVVAVVALAALGGKLSPLFNKAADNIN